MQQHYWRLSTFYLFYFASLGALVPFWSLYLDHLDFNAIEIGQLMATLAVSKVVAPYIWGWIADRSGFHIRIVQITSLISVLCMMPLLWFDSYWAMMGFMLLFSFFWNASLPQFEVVTLGHLGEDKYRYSQIRLWGSLGFIIMVVILGAAFQWIHINHLPLILVLLFVLIWLSSLTVDEYRSQQHEDVRIGSVLKRPEVIAMLLGCFFMQASHGPYYTFFSIYMEELGQTRFEIGLLWSLGVLAEVILFMFMYRLLQFRGAGFWLFMSLLLTTVRWLLMAWFAEYLWMVVLAQCLHAASFGLFHASAIHLIHQFFPHHHGRGQALYSAMSFGAGGAVGSLYAGSLWQHVTPEWSYLFAALVSFIGMLIVLKVKRF